VVEDGYVHVADVAPEVRGTVLYIRDHVIPTAHALLPAKLDSRAARAMELAIGLQESRFEARRQFGGGPARGFWQFENGGGVHGVLTHHATKPLITPVLFQLRYQPGECYFALEHNDVLAACFARLLLWSHPGPLPGADEANEAWDYYRDTWRPGKPHRPTWEDFYRQAWDLVEGRIVA
jgi:hypothetical protein